jgi:hypothetical protein
MSMMWPWPANFIEPRWSRITMPYPVPLFIWQIAASTFTHTCSTGGGAHWGLERGSHLLVVEVLKHNCTILSTYVCHNLACKPRWLKTALAISSIISRIPHVPTRTTRVVAWIVEAFCRKSKITVSYLQRISETTWAVPAPWHYPTLRPGKGAKAKYVFHKLWTSTENTLILYPDISLV